MAASLDQFVRDRAGDICEYCLMPQRVRRLRFPTDHIIARQHGGGDTVDNLALCCGRCNRHKGPNIAGIDPRTKSMVRLFNPRTDAWAVHFRWNGPRVAGRTPVGRATVEVLVMNHPDGIAIRLELISTGAFPPSAGKGGTPGRSS